MPVGRHGWPPQMALATASSTRATNTPVTIKRRLFGFTALILRGHYRGCMQRLVVHAMSIDDVRDIFRAPPPLAERLRAVAAERFATPHPSRRTWFAPLTRRDPATEVDASRPLRTDVDALLTGAYIAPERVPQSWTIFMAWLEELSVAHREIPYDGAAFERVEWDLARCGLNSDYALRSLAERQLGVPLRPMPHQVAGYAKRVHALEALEDFRRVLDNPECAAESRAWLEPVVDVLESVAATEGPDVVVVGAD